MAQKREIIQFGDRLNNLFVFPPFESEDDWGDTLSNTSQEMMFHDGAYVNNGYGQSRKESKVVTKRFTIYNKELNEKEGKSYLTKVIDSMYRGLSNGKKRLYARMEDGSIRYCVAERLSIPYASTYSDSSLWASFSVDFKIYDPYWYSITDTDTVMFENVNVDVLYSPCQLKDIMNMGQTGIKKLRTDMVSTNCSGQSVIIKDSSLVGLHNCDSKGCSFNDCVLNTYGSVFFPPENAGVCVTGSAGADKPKIGWRGDWINPKLTNLTNNTSIQYNGILSGSDYLLIDQGSTITNDIADMTIDTNIVGLNINNIVITNPCGVFELDYGNNSVQASGWQNLNSFFSIKFKNKYHN